MPCARPVTVRSPARELSQQLGVSRAAVWARIEDLRSLGYDIEASPHLGYRLLSAPDLLHADDLVSRLGKTKVIGRDIRVFQETTSTNDVIEKLARDGVKEGAVVFAESQTSGPGTAGAEMDVAGQQRALVFRPAPARVAPAGNHPAHGRLGHRAAAGHRSAYRPEAGNQMAQ